MLYARCDKARARFQTLKEHSENVSKYAEAFASKFGMGAAGRLLGAIHDCGKAPEDWQTYLGSGADEKLWHSIYAAKLIAGIDKNTSHEKIASLVFSAVVFGHHGGLPDLLSPDGETCLIEKLEREKLPAMDGFFAECFDIDSICGMFKSASDEFKKIWSTILNTANHYSARDERMKNAVYLSAGLLARLLCSVLIDADRLDAAAWECQTDVEKDRSGANVWWRLADRLDKYVAGLDLTSRIGRLRKKISYDCLAASNREGGIYQLFVPTGGGKTLSSLRFAVNHAGRLGKERIFYIIPYTTIIEQTAAELRKALGEDGLGRILEHHSAIADESEEHEKYAERWNAEILLTTQVQFFDALFSGKTGSARRMHQLCNSVIVFDEVQAMPLKCMNLFCCAVEFLRNICNCTIVLCTATQPPFARLAHPIRLAENPQLTENHLDTFRALRRTRLIDARNEAKYSPSSLANFVVGKCSDVGSTLVILNTKKTVQELYEDLEKQKVSGLFHLSTAMCAAHRSKVIEKIKSSLASKEPVVCVSTNLIEAGVDISFECVVRALAGLDSIAQAAGRCNRHREADCRDVFIVDCEEGELRHLESVRKGQIATRRVLDEFRADPSRFDSDLLSPTAIELYYSYYFNETASEMDYILPDKVTGGAESSTMIDLLGANAKALRWATDRGNKKALEQQLWQSFRTAGENFHVISSPATGVIVPYGDGKQIIERLQREKGISEKKKLLREAQRFTVNLFEYQLKKLVDGGAVMRIPEIGAYALDEGWYSDKIGVDFGREKSVDEYIL